MIDLYISYWNGEFYVGCFPNKETAERHYNKNKSRYRDYAGEKHGFPYGIPVYCEIKNERK